MLRICCENSLYLLWNDNEYREDAMAIQIVYFISRDIACLKMLQYPLYMFCLRMMDDGERWDNNLEREIISSLSLLIRNSLNQTYLSEIHHRSCHIALLLAYFMATIVVINATTIYAGQPLSHI